MSFFLYIIQKSESVYLCVGRGWVCGGGVCDICPR